MWHHLPGIRMSLRFPGWVPGQPGCWIPGSTEGCLPPGSHLDPQRQLLRKPKGSLSRGDWLPCAQASGTRPASDGVSGLRTASLKGSFPSRTGVTDPHGSRCPSHRPTWLEASKTFLHPLHAAPASVRGDLGVGVDDPTHSPCSLNPDLQSSLPLMATPSTASSLETLRF